MIVAIMLACTAENPDPFDSFTNTDKTPNEDTAQPTEPTLPLDFGELPEGNLLWSTPISDEGVQTQDFVGGKVVVWNSFGDVSAFDPVTGSPLWLTALNPDHNGELPFDGYWPVSTPGLVHLHWGGPLWALRAEDGEIAWTVPGNFTQLAATGNRLAALETSDYPFGYVHLFDATTGEALWDNTTNKLLQLAMTDTLVAGLTLDTLANTYQMLAWDLATGAVVWQGDSLQAFTPPDFSSWIEPPQSTQIEDTLVFQSRTFMVAVDAATGATLWTREMAADANRFVDPLVSGGLVITNHDDAPDDTEERYDSLVGIEPRTGATVWSLRLATATDDPSIYWLFKPSAGATFAVHTVAQSLGGPYDLSNIVVDTVNGQPQWRLPSYWSSTDGERVFMLGGPGLIAFGPPEGL